ERELQGGAGWGWVVAARAPPAAGGGDGIRPDPPRLGATRPGAARAARKFIRLARLRPFARQDRARSREPRGAWRMGWKNPANGRGALYLASHAYAVEGMEQAAGQKPLPEPVGGAAAPGLRLSPHVP